MEIHVSTKHGKSIEVDGGRWKSMVVNGIQWKSMEDNGKPLENSMIKNQIDP